MKDNLASWFAIWHRRYRKALVQLLLAGTIAAALVYFQNSLLGLLTPSLAMSFPEGPASSAPSGVPAWFSMLSQRTGLWLPLMVLGLFIIARAMSAATEFWKTHVAGRLRVRAEDDLEAEILQHLLRNDDAFFGRHSPAETVNRLAVDLYRVSDRRPELMTLWWSGLLIVGNLAFFFLKDWRLALVALAGCLTGALWTHRMTRHVKQLDGDYLRQNDSIKSRFEDFLRTAPEVQVGRLYGKIGRDFRRLQEVRTSTFLKYVRLNAWLSVGNVASSLLAFVAMILVILYQLRTGVVSLALGLVPVVIWALPALFQQAAHLVFVHVQFQLARTSMTRLLEYETQPIEPYEDVAPAPAPADRSAPLRMQGATYRYSGPDEAPQGGVSEIDATFAPGTWTAVVGGAGSGKSTLLKLLLGRLKPQSGQVLCGQTPLDQMPGAALAQLLSLMPQSPGLLDGTIRQNLLFGRAPEALAITEADLAVLEQTGLADVCRAKALEMTPGDAGETADWAGRIAGLRGDLRDALRVECGLSVLPYEAAHTDGAHWTIERLLGGKCDRIQTITRLLGKTAERTLKPLRPTRLAGELVDAGRGVLRATRRLLDIASFQAYCQLAPRSLDERIWKLRTSHAELADRTPRSFAEEFALWLIALTSAPVERLDEPPSESLDALTTLDGAHQWSDALGTLVAEACRPFTIEEVHPYLTWRENLVFGVLNVPNSRFSRMVDATILDFLRRRNLQGALARMGLDYQVGRLGSNLSGGQGQLVALCRAVLRGTVVLILDEPTSALDPASCMRIAEFLGNWKADRIVITVSHNPELIRQADEIKLMDGGRLVACGTFEQLKDSSEAFRRTLRQT